MPRGRPRKSDNPVPGNVATEEKAPAVEAPKVSRFRVIEGKTEKAEESEMPNSTSKSLFPDFLSDAGDLMKAPPQEEPEAKDEGQKPESKPEPTPQEPTTKEVEKDPEPTPEKPDGEPDAPSEILDLANLSGKKVRVKVDGIEMDVPVEQLQAHYQLKVHLDRKGERLNEREREILSLRKQILEAQTKPKDAEAGDYVPGGEETEKDPTVEALRRELEKTRKDVQEMAQVISRVRLEEKVNALHSQMKETLGFDDFKSYVPKIQEFIRGQLSDPANPTPQEVASFDNAQFFVSKYQEMKLREMATKAATPAKPEVVKQDQAKKPVLGPAIEGAGGRSGETENESLTVQYQKAFAKAKNSGREADWLEVMRLKRKTQPSEVSVV